MQAKDVGSIIRRHRKERGLTQIDLAAMIGVQQSDLSRMERGEYRVSLESLFRLLEVFSLNFDEFFNLDAHHEALEADLLATFRSFDSVQKGQAIALLKGFLADSRDDQDSPRAMGQE